MIHVRISTHWRVRRSEWLLALCTFALGVVYVSTPGLFITAYFATMLSIMSQWAWGMVAMTIGGARLVLLAINGAWRASPHGRAALAQASCGLWLLLFVTAISADALVQSVGFWLLFFVFDAFSAIDAAGDARMADEKARASRNAGTGNAGIL